MYQRPPCRPPATAQRARPPATSRSASPHRDLPGRIRCGQRMGGGIRGRRRPWRPCMSRCSTPPGKARCPHSQRPDARLTGSPGIGELMSQPDCSVSHRRFEEPSRSELSAYRRAILGRSDAQRRCRHDAAAVGYQDCDISLESGRLGVRRRGAADAPAAVCVPACRRTFEDGQQVSAVHHEDESVPVGGASWRGRATAPGLDRRSGHHRSVSIPTPTPNTHPPAMSDG